MAIKMSPEYSPMNRDSESRIGEGVGRVAANSEKGLAGRQSD
jgi:hypothetical protein